MWVEGCQIGILFSGGGNGGWSWFVDEPGLNLADGLFDIGVEIIFGAGDEVVHAEDAGDGSRGETEDTKDICQLVPGGCCVTGFDQLIREDADEGDLIEEAFKVGDFFSGGVVFLNASGVEAVFETIEVAEGCAAATMGGIRHKS